MTQEQAPESVRRRPWVRATCIALVLAAIADAGPEILESGTLLARYDGPGPLIYLAFAAVVATVRRRFTPLLAVVMAAFFLVGGFASADFSRRLTGPVGVEPVAAWLQVLSFAAVVAFGTAAVTRRPARPVAGPS